MKNNNNNIIKNIVPVVSYFNIDANKSIIYKENKGKNLILNYNIYIYNNIQLLYIKSII
jgi:hypothetical protein